MRPDVEVVHQQDVDPPGAEPVQAVLDRAHDAVVAVVVDLGERQRAFELAVVEGVGMAGLEQAADLGRQHEALARPVAQRRADPVLRQAEAVEWCRIEQADAGIVGGAHRRLGLRVGDRPVHVAERRAAKAELGHGQTGSAEHTRIASSHGLAPCCLRPVPRWIRTPGSSISKYHAPSGQGNADQASKVPARREGQGEA